MAKAEKSWLLEIYKFTSWRDKDIFRKCPSPSYYSDPQGRRHKQPAIKHRKKKWISDFKEKWPYKMAKLSSELFSSLKKNPTLRLSHMP